MSLLPLSCCFGLRPDTQRDGRHTKRILYMTETLAHCCTICMVPLWPANVWRLHQIVNKKKNKNKPSSLSKCSGIRHLTSRIATKQHPFENKRSSSPSSSSPPPRPAISTSKCYMPPTRFGSRATTTTIRSDVRSSSCICVSGRRWSTASVCGASSTAAVTGAQAAEVLGTAAWTVSCPIGQQNIARSAGATSS